MRFIGNAPVDGEVRAIASGALATGEAVLVNSDGTVSVVEETGVSQVLGSDTVFETAESNFTRASYDANAGKVVIAFIDAADTVTSPKGKVIVGTVSGTSISFGSPVTFHADSTNFMDMIYHEAAQKVVIVYYDGDNSGYGTSVVGTVSGTSISFGSTVVFNSANTSYPALAYDSASEKVVVSYRTTSDVGKSQVGTVSGTSISWGAAVTYNSGATGAAITSTYDANEGHVVVAYQDQGNSSYGTAIVGTVSGTSISFGSETVFEAATTNNINMDYDATAQKVVIAYRDGGNSNYGTAIVGTVSGTSISFGTPSVYNAANTTQPAVDYNGAAGSVVISYNDGGNSNLGTFVTATVSGTSLTFSSETVYSSGGTLYNDQTFDSANNRMVVVYRDQGNSNYGTAVVFQPAYTSTNLTSENFVGFANSGYADGQSAALNSTCSVDKNQSGLTAGETYYVQTDGTLGTTPADPSVVAGTAISSNSIIVKG
jgi:hypothetical protein